MEIALVILFAFALAAFIGWRRAGHLPDPNTAQGRAYYASRPKTEGEK